MHFSQKIFYEISECSFFMEERMAKDIKETLRNKVEWAGLLLPTRHIPGLLQTRQHDTDVIRHKISVQRMVPVLNSAEAISNTHEEKQTPFHQAQSIR